MPAVADPAVKALAELLNGDITEDEALKKLRAPRKPRAKLIVVPEAGPKTKTADKVKAMKTATVRTPKADLPEAILKTLKGATPEQHERARVILGYDAGATFKRPDADGDIIATYVPKWEQGRMKDGEFAKGPGRRFVYLVDRGGHLSGHGFKYRSTAAEKKLAPLEEVNNKRIARETKKAAA